MLVVGTDKRALVKNLPDRFLFLDHSGLIEAIPAQKSRGTRLDLSRHSLNPLRGIDYAKAVQFIDILDAAFPAGQSTLTKENAHFQILSALLNSPKRLATLVPRSKETQAAFQKIQRLLLSPVLLPFLTRPTNLRLNGILLADLSGLPEFDRFIIGNIIIANYAGDIVVPDFGFYGCRFHPLERMRVGVNFLDETPFKQKLLLMPHKIGAGCLARDAETLAEFQRLVPGTVAFTAFVQEAVA